MTPVPKWEQEFEDKFYLLGTDERDFDGSIVREEVKAFIRSAIEEAREDGRASFKEEVLKLIDKHDPQSNTRTASAYWGNTLRESVCSLPPTEGGTL